MRASKVGWLGWASVWVSLGALAGCQLAFGIDLDGLPAEDTTGSAGVSFEGGGGGVAGFESDRAGGGQGGVSEQAGGGQGGGGQGGSAGGLPRPEPTLLASGGFHTCVRDQGVARCWGHNQYGQLGITANNGTLNPNPVPALVDSGVLTGVLQPALGDSHSCALRADGRVLCWGQNFYGQLGTSANNGTGAPNPVPALVGEAALGVVRQLALGEVHSCALRTDGRVLCWGQNFYGQLGTSANNGIMTPSPVPALVDDATLGVVKQLALGIAHSCALRDDGRVLCWGFNRYGQLGSSATSGTDTPTPVPTLVDHESLGVVTQLAVGIYHSCALRDDGHVLCWGYNYSGQLGTSVNNGTANPNPVPALVNDVTLSVAKQLALGGYHSCALREDGRVLCWGHNEYGQLGSSAPSNPNPVPALVDDAALGVVKQLALGIAHSCALRDDGRVLCWGFNRYGQLGSSATSGTNNPTIVPTLVEGLPPLVP
jgi:alpha-tubulin suppressor-like RCC1 family protein